MTNFFLSNCQLYNKIWLDCSDAHIIFFVTVNADEQFSSRVSSAVVASRYGSAASARSAPEVLQSSGYRLTSAKTKRGLRIDDAGAITNDLSDDEIEDPTLYISPGSEKALVGVTR